MSPSWMSNVDQKLKLIMTSFPDSALILLFALFVLALAGVAIAFLILLVRRSRSSYARCRGGSSARAMLMEEVEHGRVTDDDEENDDHREVAAGGSSNWVTIRKVLMSSMRWSEGSRLAEEEIMMISSSVSSCSSGRSCNYRVEEVAPVPEESTVSVQPRGQAVERGGGGGGYNWRRDGHVGSSAATGPVWQRPILMGEKCELPKFSGLILYDQRGIPLHQYRHHGSLTSSDHHHNQHLDQKEEAATRRTTLRDLM